MNRSRILILAALALSLVVVGCSDDDDEQTTIIQPVELAPQVHALVLNEGPRRGDSDDRCQAYVVVSAYPVVPTVTVNEQPLIIEPELTIFGGGLGFYGHITESAHGTTDLLVDFGDAAEAGTASLPALGHSDVVGDPDIGVVPGEPLVLTWGSATNAETYWVQCDFEVEYLGDDETSHYWETVFETFVTDTSMTLAATDLFPADVAIEDITYFWGDVDIMPAAGPIQAGDVPNMEGCGGTLISFGSGLDWDLSLAETPTKAADTGREQTVDPLRFLGR